MGKSEHESFSFTGKSDLRLLKKNPKEKSAKKRFREKNEKKGGKSEGEKKEKSHFWWRWMGFLRRCPNKKNLQLEKKTNLITDHAFERWNNVNAPAINIIEIPIEPGRKISKILIKPTESGIQAMIAQYGPPFPDPDAALCRQGEPQNACREALALRGAQINVPEEHPKSEEKRFVEEKDEMKKSRKRETAG